MKQWLFNPFRYLAGVRALLIGLFIMLLTAFIASYSKTHFDGVLDIHFTSFVAPVQVLLIEQLIDWLGASLIFYITGLILSKSSIRSIDIAGTMALARWPMLIVALMGFFIQVPPPSADLMKNLNASVIIGGLVSVIFSVWMIALIYRAFAVSCNAKGTNATIGFILALVLAEFGTKLLLLQIIHKMM